MINALSNFFWQNVRFLHNAFCICTFIFKFYWYMLVPKASWLHPVGQFVALEVTRESCSTSWELVNTTWNSVCCNTVDLCNMCYCLVLCDCCKCLNVHNLLLMFCVFQTLLSKDKQHDCHNVTGISSTQLPLSADSCPAVNSSPQYVLDTETGTKHLSHWLSCL